MLTIFLATGFSAHMKTPTTAGALRVARALLGLSQRDAAQETGLNKSTIWEAEHSNSERYSANLSLMSFYQSRGVEFVGETTFNGLIFRSGACWSSPKDRQASADRIPSPHSRFIGASFLAARALVDLTQDQVGSALGLSRKTIAALEKSASWDADHERLRTFYDGCHVEFLGSSNAATNEFSGIGVRWKGYEPEPNVTSADSTTNDQEGSNS